MREPRFFNFEYFDGNIRRYADIIATTPAQARRKFEKNYPDATVVIDYQSTVGLKTKTYPGYYIKRKKEV